MKNTKRAINFYKNKIKNLEKEIIRLNVPKIAADMTVQNVHVRTFKLLTKIDKSAITQNVPKRVREIFVDDLKNLIRLTSIQDKDCIYVLSHIEIANSGNIEDDLYIEFAKERSIKEDAEIIENIRKLREVKK